MVKVKRCVAHTLWVTVSLLLVLACGAGDEVPGSADAPAAEPGGGADPAGAEISDGAGSPIAAAAADTPAGAPAAGSADLRRRVAEARESDGVLEALGPGPEWLERYAGRALEELFAAIAAGIRYEPYAGVLRGARGTAVAGAGNAWDQSLLLLELLRAAGHRARLARGTLEEGNVDVLLRGLYPPRLPDIERLEGLPLFDPAGDPRLRALAEDHVWVEVERDGSWIPLDPSFPRAVPGEAYARADTRLEEAPSDRYQRLRVTVRQERASGRTETAGELERRVAELAYRPLSLLGREVGILEAPEPAGAARGGPASMLGGLAGGLGGRAPEPEGSDEASPAEPVAVGYRLERRLEVGEETVELATTEVRDRDRRSGVRREWIELELLVPGAPPRRLERVLFEADGPGDRPAAHRRYTLTVVPGPTPWEALREQRDRVGARLPADAWARELEAAAGEDTEGAVLVSHLDLRERAAGTAAAHLANLAFAAESDALAGRIARTHAVKTVQATPRLLLMAVETREEADGSVTEASLDLRLDEIDAIPYAGAPEGAGVLFRTARGLQNAVLEGAVLARLLDGATPVTAARLMERAHEEGVAVHVATPENRSALRSARGLPARERQRLESSLAAGRHLVLPASAVRLEGRERWGWWDLDPETGHVIGVLEGGGHQATVEYKLTTTRVGIRDDMAYAIGAMTGATTTNILIAAKILEYGGVTPELVADVTRWLEGFSCSACPKAEVGVSAEVQVKVSEGCFEKELFKRDAGLSAGVNFCGKYNDGFSCASGMILAGLRAAAGEEAGPSGPRVSSMAQLTGEAVVGCHRQSDTYGPASEAPRAGDVLARLPAPPAPCGGAG